MFFQCLDSASARAATDQVTELRMISVMSFADWAPRQRRGWDEVESSVDDASSDCGSELDRMASEIEHVYDYDQDYDPANPMYTRQVPQTEVVALQEELLQKQLRALQEVVAHRNGLSDSSGVTKHYEEVCKALEKELETLSRDDHVSKTLPFTADPREDFSEETPCDYDPANPDYIQQVSETEASALQEQLLRQQITALEGAVARRRSDSFGVAKHYEQVQKAMTEECETLSKDDSSLSLPSTADPDSSDTEFCDTDFSDTDSMPSRPLQTSTSKKSKFSANSRCLQHGASLGLFLGDQVTISDAFLDDFSDECETFV